MISCVRCRVGLENTCLAEFTHCKLIVFFHVIVKVPSLFLPHFYVLSFSPSMWFAVNPWYFFMVIIWSLAESYPLSTDQWCGSTTEKYELAKNKKTRRSVRVQRIQKVVSVLLFDLIMSTLKSWLAEGSERKKGSYREQLVGWRHLGVCDSC